MDQLLTAQAEYKLAGLHDQIFTYLI